MPVTDPVPSVADKALSRLAARDSQGAIDAAELREHIRKLTDDPVLTLLTRSLERQADATDSLVESVTRGIAEMKQEVSDSSTRLLRSVVVITVVALMLMGGLVGVQSSIAGKFAVSSPNVAEVDLSR